MALTVGAALFGACAPSQPSTPTPPLTSSTSTTVGDEQEHGDEPLRGPARATLALQAAERARLGLPPAGTSIDADHLARLTDGQWADPEVVAGRFALVRTNYEAAEDVSALEARSAPYVVPRLRDDLVSSSGGSAGLTDLRDQGVVFTGDVVGLVTSERSDDRALVDLTVRRGQGFYPGRVEFWRLTLVREPGPGHWLVADLELS
jgi:hypothetical protein